ncbi:MAG: hypothetical protein ABIZ91_18055 [Gemmatimonadaceae bacterium]
MSRVMVIATGPASTSRAVGTLRWTVVALLGVLACAENPVAPDHSAPGAPARILATTISVAGGQSFRRTMEIDSASGTYQYGHCRATPSLSECAEPAGTRSGSVSGQSLQALFASA